MKYLQPCDIINIYNKNVDSSKIQVISLILNDNFDSVNESRKIHFIIWFIQAYYKCTKEQEPVKQGDAPRIGFGLREVVCL